MKQIDDLKLLYAQVLRHDKGICQCKTCEKIRIIAARMVPTFVEIYDAAKELVDLHVGKMETKLTDTLAKLKQF